jgi:GntR family transcriptional repressor for pyruvate dehydrogenase complex
MKVEPIMKSSAANKVFVSLHEMIVSGQFRPGEILPSQDKLARQLCVSRNTLREAIHKLSAMGLLTAKQGVGTAVEPMSPAGYLTPLEGHLRLDSMSVREFIEARACLERTIVSLSVARAKRKDIQSLKAILELQKQALQKGDQAECVRQDVAFHMELGRVAGNRVLVKILQTIWGMLHAFISEVAQLPGAIEDALRFHSDIVAAVAAKKGDQAEEIMLRHILDVVRRIERNLKVDLKAHSLFGLDAILSKKALSKKSRGRRFRTG